MENDILKHYGVLGMKWGIRRYQSYSQVPRKSGEGGKEVGKAKRAAKFLAKYPNGYEYHSMATKKYDRKAKKETDPVKKAIYESRRDISAKMDKKEQEFAEQTELSTVALDRLGLASLGLGNPLTGKAVQQYKAMGKDSVTAALLAWVGGTPLSRIYKAVEIRKGDEEAKRKAAANEKNDEIQRQMQETEQIMKKGRSTAQKMAKGNFNFTDEEKDSFFGFYDSTFEGDGSESDRKLAKKAFDEYMAYMRSSASGKKN